VVAVDVFGMAVFRAYWSSFRRVVSSRYSSIMVAAVEEEVVVGGEGDGNAMRCE
jgi:hypothetical protein